MFKLNISISQRIKTPFEKALDSLKFIEWKYSNSKRVSLINEKVVSVDYKIFENLYVKFNVVGFSVEAKK